MKIAVLIKQTPDTAELPKVSAGEVQSGEVNATMVINPWDEYAAEEAIQLSERFDAGTVALTLGSPDAVDVLKHALAMGIGEAKLIDNGGVGGGDLWSTAALLAAAIRAEGDVYVVLSGKQSVDENSSSVFIGVAQMLGCPLLTNVVKVVDIGAGHITVERNMDGEQETVQAPLPAVVSVGKEINDPRYPSFMGIRKASRAKIPSIDAGDLGVEGLVGRTMWTNIRKPEERKSEVQIIDGATDQERASNLANALIAEKII